MKKIVLRIVICLIIVAALSQGHIINAVLNLILAGVIPGTPVVVPYWLMMSLYSGAIAVVVTIYVEKFLIARHEQKQAAAHKSRMPRRRYSHI